MLCLAGRCGGQGDSQLEVYDTGVTFRHLQIRPGYLLLSAAVDYSTEHFQLPHP